MMFLKWKKTDRIVMRNQLLIVRKFSVYLWQKEYSVIDNFEFNKNFLESLSLGAHYSRTEKPKQFDKPTEELEKWLWDILKSGGKLESLNGTINIKNLFEQCIKQNNIKKEDR